MLVISVKFVLAFTRWSASTRKREGGERGIIFLVIPDTFAILMIFFRWILAPANDCRGKLTDCGYDEAVGNCIVITTDSLISFGVRLMVTPGTKISIHSRND